MAIPSYKFSKDAAISINSGLTRSLVLQGNIHDLFFISGASNKTDGDYVPLVEYLTSKWSVSGIILLSVEPSGRLRVCNKTHLAVLRKAWDQWKTDITTQQFIGKERLSIERIRSQTPLFNKSFDQLLSESGNNSILLMDFLRQLCACSRTKIANKSIIQQRLIILIEGADMFFPCAPTSNLSTVDRRMIGMCEEWFCDPLFLNGNNAVVMICESRSKINDKISQLPQLVSFDISYPEIESRAHYISWFSKNNDSEEKQLTRKTTLELAKQTGGLSLHALRQLLLKAKHLQKEIHINDIIKHVEHYIQSLLCEDVVEFKKPQHTLSDIVGFSKLKQFLKNEFIPKLKSTDPEGLSGAVVCGAVGSGKTYIFEAVAAEADMVVLVLKNLRSQWFGQTDVLFSRLKNLLFSLSNVLIMIDEADTQFSGIGSQAHPTERRLLGNIQQLMSEPKLRGKVKWLLMTARVHLLSPDLRRPGRAGDMIIPVLDPDKKDRNEFLKWVLKDICSNDILNDRRFLNKLSKQTDVYSSASFASLKAELKLRAKKKKLSKLQIEKIVWDILPADIHKTRRFQELQALVNCTRRSLISENILAKDDNFELKKEQWLDELHQFELEGIS
jgi:SpoVK/Ycf46/Vps4 family AAA+-type ATPase